MKKSQLASKSVQKRHVESSSTVSATSSTPKPKANKSIRKRNESISSVSSSISSTQATEIYNPVAKANHEALHHQRKKHEDEHGSVHEDDNSSEEDIEYDEEVFRKLLERKIGQAPAAKVIVSDAMMRGALGEINARKSAASTTVKSSIQSMTTIYSNQVDSQLNTTASASITSISGAKPMRKSIGKTAGHAKDDGGRGDSVTTNRESSSNTNNSCAVSSENINSAGNVKLWAEEVEHSAGCPLEKVLEFLEAVMTKDYKRALILGKEVEKYEPDNELVLEYMSVLQQIVNKEDEKDYAQGSDSDTSSSDAGEYSDDLTTSSETDNVSEEDSESSTECSVSTSTSGKESEKNEGHHYGECNVQDCEEKNDDTVLGESEENEETNESLNGTSISCGVEMENVEILSKDNDEHVHCRENAEDEVL